MTTLLLDCYSCTEPGNSGANGLKIANALERKGEHVIGWDLEWNMNFKINRSDRIIIYCGKKEEIKWMRA